MTEENVSQFEKINAQLQSLYEEVGALSKKSQNDPLNKFKLRFINSALSSANTLLGDLHKPYADFVQFDENDLPSNSDAAVMLGQYLSCMEKLRADNIIVHVGQWVWKIDGRPSVIRTTVPDKIRIKK